MLPNIDRQKRAQPIVETPDVWVMSEPPFDSVSAVPVAFKAEVLDDFVGIQRKSNAPMVHSDIGESIVE